jgi:hypothetical protein
MKPLVDMIGLVFGRLTVVARAENTKGGGAQWVCRCECGEQKVNTRKNLIKGRVRSCGCLRRETSREIGLRSRTHGQAVLVTPEYKAWVSALGRCHNPRHKQWELYGGRGIHVADEWRDDFAAFFAYIGPKPSPQHSLDRIDPNRGYEPGNVRWADWFVQGNNRRNNHMVVVDGVRMTLAEAIRLKGQKSSRVRQRLANGWDIERALNESSRNQTDRKG